MFGELKILYDWFLDKSKSISQRFATLVSIVAILLISDYVTNFSYDVHISNKLENLELVNNLKTTYRNDSIHYSDLLEIEHRILNRIHYFDFIRLHWSKMDFKSLIVDQQNHHTNIETKKIIKPIRSIYWMVFSSSYLLVIAFGLFLFFPLYSKEKNTVSLYIGWFASLILASLLIAFITWTAYLIPVINNNPIWNYILNGIIHSCFIWISIHISKKKK